MTMRPSLRNVQMSRLIPTVPSMTVALQAATRAVAADSGFALAWYRLGIAAQWLTQQDLVTKSLARAEALSAHLPERTQQLLEAAEAAHAGNFQRAEQLYRAITGAAPDDVEAWMQLGELLFHDAPLNGRDFTQLALVQPGIISLRNTDSIAQKGFGTRISMAGSRPDQTAWLLDGTNIKSMSNLAGS